MKKLIGILCLFITLTASADDEKRISSTIDQVTVFLKKAQIERSAETILQAGNSQVILQGLSHSIDPQSIQVSGKGSFIILGVKHQNNYLQENEMPKELRVLTDSLKYYTNQIIFKQNSREVLNKEEALLLANQKITGSQESLTAAQLKAMADFFRERMNDISLAKIEVEEELRVLTIQKAAVQNQINQYRSIWVRNSGEIVVSVSAKSSAKAVFNVSYLVNNAGWSPIYDIRATNVDSPIALNYRANVYQNTGIDWKDVKLVLSTGNPSIGGYKPVLNPWYLNIYEPLAKSQAKYRMSRAAPESKMELDDIEVGYGVANEEVLAESVSNYTEVVETSLNTRFNISLKYNILTGGKPELVEIQEHKLEASYQYSVAPKLDADAFLLAYITGWEELNLLPGEANVYFEGTFINKSFIDPASTLDTLNLSLGRDKKIVVERKNVTDFTSKKTFGGKKKILYVYEIEVRNTKSVPVNIVVEDQVPISQNKEITVEMISNSGAKYNAGTGKLSWDMKLDPKKSRKVRFEFEVQYPKDKRISNL